MLVVLAMIIIGLAGGFDGDVIDLKGAGADGAGAGSGAGVGLGVTSGVDGGVVAGRGSCGAAQAKPVATKLNSIRMLIERNKSFFTELSFQIFINEIPIKKHLKKEVLGPMRVAS